MYDTVFAFVLSLKASMMEFYFPDGFLSTTFDTQCVEITLSVFLPFLSGHPSEFDEYSPKNTSIKTPCQAK